LVDFPFTFGECEPIFTYENIAYQIVRNVRNMEYSEKQQHSAMSYWAGYVAGLDEGGNLCNKDAGDLLELIDSFYFGVLFK